ncbi:MAG: TonB-dependent receptor [Terriglobales bacterium]
MILPSGRPMLRLVLLMVASLLMGHALVAQEATGRIIGTVTDAQGAVIPGAHIVVTDVSTQVRRDSTSDAAGNFQVLSLPISSYSVTASKEGFREAVVPARGLQIGQSLRFDIRLQIGANNQTVTVDAAAAQVETVNPTLGESITSRPVQDLPLNGRNVLDLALLQPGVTETDNPGNGTPSGPQAFSIAGGRQDSVTYLLDGGNNNNLLSNGVVLNPNPDAIAEFRILTSNYTAEYGRNGGGIVSVVTKSGTNQLHGSGFDFLRNDALNANSYFNNLNGVPRSVLKRNQYGFTVGGPVDIPHVIHGQDKVFFFLAYQGQKQTQAISSPRTTVYTPAELNGDFSKSGPNGTPDAGVAGFLQANPYYQANPALQAQAVIDPTKINSIIKKYISAGFIPSSPSGQLISQATGKDDANEWTGKIDVNASASDKLQFTLGASRTPSFVPLNIAYTSAVGFPYTDKYGRYFSSSSYTKVFSPTLLNVARVTLQRLHKFQAYPARTLPTASQLGIGITPDNPTGPPRIELFSSGLQVGFNPQGPTSEVDNTFEYSDTLTWVKGNHNFKFGGSFSPYQNNTVYDYYVNGDFFFYGQGGNSSQNDRADVLFGLPDEYLQFGAAPSNIRSKSTYAFGQDEWKVTRNLVLTLGLRYEYSTPKLDTQGRSFSLVNGAHSTRFPGAPTGLLFPGDAGAPKGANFPDRNDFAPRVGFAWDPWGRGRTSVRGGMGVFYDILKGEDNLQFNGQAPFFGFSDLFYSPLAPGTTSEPNYLSQPYVATGSPNPFPSKPPASNIDFNAAGFLPFGGGGVYFVDPRLRTPYTLQYNLSLQQQVGRSMTVETSFVGSVSHKLTSLVDSNPFVLGSSPAVRVLNTVPGGSYSYLDTFKNIGNQAYSSLEASLKKQVSSSAFGDTYFMLGYTWAHNIDNVSGFRQRNSRIPAYSPNQFRGNSDIDVRHRVTFSGGWDMPFQHLWAGGPKALTKGWSLYPIATYRTGFPLDVTAGLQRTRGNPGPSGAGDSDLVRANLVGSSVVTLDPHASPDATYFKASNFNNAVTSGYGTLPRNFFRGPGRANFDLALAKITGLGGDRVTAEFRAEFFNILNVAGFKSPSTNINDPTNFGKISSTYDPRIGQVALRFRF